MPDLTILADMAGRHTPHDVYDLWTRTRDASLLFGWQTAAGEQVAFCLDARGELHPVAVPWDVDEAAARWSFAAPGGRELWAGDELGAGGDPAAVADLDLCLELEVDGSIPILWEQDFMYCWNS